MGRTVNGISAETLTNYLARIFEIEDECTLIMMTAASKCRTEREDVALILEEAERNGIGKKAMRAIIKRAKAERSAKKATSGHEPEIQNVIDAACLALQWESTPLAGAIVTGDESEPADPPAPATAEEITAATDAEIAANRATIETMEGLGKVKAAAEPKPKKPRAKKPTASAAFKPGAAGDDFLAKQIAERRGATNGEGDSGLGKGAGDV